MHRGNTSRSSMWTPAHGFGPQIGGLDRMKLGSLGNRHPLRYRHDGCDAACFGVRVDDRSFSRRGSWGPTEGLPWRRRRRRPLPLRRSIATTPFTTRPPPGVTEDLCIGLYAARRKRLPIRVCLVSRVNFLVVRHVPPCRVECGSDSAMHYPTSRVNGVRTRRGYFRSSATRRSRSSSTVPVFGRSRAPSSS